MSKKKRARNKKSAKKKKDTKKPPDTLPLESVPSLQSMEGFMAGIRVTGRSKGRAVDEAQEIMYRAWETPTPQHAVTLAMKALSISADCADAYNLLAEETATSLEEALDLYRKGVEAGERALGKKTFKEDVGYFWGILETRPYMRARAGLAQCLWQAGQREEAVEHYWDMLRLNPGDNQGVRDLLIPCLIELGRDQDAEELFAQFEEDNMAVWMYSRTLLDFRKHGDSPTANEALKAAREGNKHVPSYLLGRKKMPRDLPDYCGFGDENEAVHYVHGSLEAWQATAGAVEWLGRKVK